MVIALGGLTHHDSYYTRLVIKQRAIGDVIEGFLSQSLMSDMLPAWFEKQFIDQLNKLLHQGLSLQTLVFIEPPSIMLLGNTPDSVT